METTLRFEVTASRFLQFTTTALVDVTLRPEIPPGLEISGRVAAGPPCDGGLNGKIVELSPLGWTAETGDIDGQPGRFRFDGVPPGSYELGLFGDGIFRCATCYPPVSVEAAADTSVDLCPSDASPTPTETPSGPSPTTTRTSTATPTPTAAKTSTPTATFTPCGARDLQTIQVEDPPHADCVTGDHHRSYNVPVDPQGVYIVRIRQGGLVQVEIANGATTLRQVTAPPDFGFVGPTSGAIRLTVSPFGGSQTDYEIDIEAASDTPVVRISAEEIDFGPEILGTSTLAGASISNDGSFQSGLRINGARIQVSEPRLANCFGFNIPLRCSSAAPCVLLGGDELTTFFSLLRTSTACSFPREPDGGPTAKLVFDLQSAPQREIPIYGETLPFACPGDCAGDGVVSKSDLLGQIGAALTRPSRRCPNYDRNGDDAITVDEVVAGVAASLGPCHP